MTLKLIENYDSERNFCENRTITVVVSPGHKPNNEQLQFICFNILLCFVLIYCFVVSK